tara:strand:- start:157 stop:396 length:240 start_codon:yes stop_codon:yes gene_type:complete
MKWLSKKEKMLYEPIMYYARNIDREIKEEYEEIEGEGVVLTDKYYTEYYIVLTYLVEDILELQRKINERVREKKENKKT